MSRGLIAWEGDITSMYQAQPITTKRAGNDIYYSLEGHYQLTKQWQLSVGFTRYALKANDVDVDVDVIYLGVDVNNSTTIFNFDEEY